MKKIPFYIFVFFLLSVFFAYAEENVAKPPFLEDVQATVGVVGIGYLLPFNPAKADMFVPNLGGIIRITKPIVKHKQMNKESITFVDFGLCAYVTGGAEEAEGIFLIGVGATLGIFKGFISLSISPTFVVGPDRSDLYLGFVFTSDSLTL